LQVPGSKNEKGTPVELKYNYILLAFYTDKAVDMVVLWERLHYYLGYLDPHPNDEAAQISTMESYHSKNIVCMVSTFGERSGEIAKEDPINVAKMHANFALNNHLDGLDADFEESNMFTLGVGADWLIKYTKEAYKFLPYPCYIITHAP